MLAKLDRIAGPGARPLRLALLGIVVAIIGAVIGLSIDYGSDNPLSFLAFAIVALGVLMGFVAIACGWVAIFLSFRKGRGEQKNAP